MRVIGALQAIVACGIFIMPAFGNAGEVIQASRERSVEWTKNLRLTTLRYPANISKAQAASMAKEAKEAGFNAVILDGHRYLFREDDEVYGPKESFFQYAGGAPFNQSVAEAKLVTEACHEKGLKVIGHLTIGCVTKAYLDKHPEQAVIDIATGEVFTNQFGAQTVSWASNPEFRKEFFRRLEHYIKETGIDGLMVDEAQWFGPTKGGDPYTRAAVKRDLGFDLPPNGSGGDWFTTANPDYRKWVDWRAEQSVATQRQMRDLLHSLNPDAEHWIYISSVGHPYAYYDEGVCADNLIRSADFIGVESEPPGRPRQYPYYWKNISMDMKFLRALSENGEAGSRSWALLYSESPLDWVWNYYTATAQNTRMWWEIITDQKKTAVPPLLAWDVAHEKLFEDCTSAADVAIVISTANRLKHPNQGRGWEGSVWMRGAYNLGSFLFDQHIPFRVLTDRHLQEGRFENAKVVLLPSMAILDAQQLAQLEKFVSAGGSVIATGEIATLDGTGQPADQQRLKALFGVRLDGSTISGSTTLSPLKEMGLPELKWEKERQNVSLVSGDAIVRASDSAKAPVWVEHAFGKGKAVYFSVPLERSYQTQFYAFEAIEPGKYWKDQRDPLAAEWLRAALSFALKEPAVTAVGFPKGVVVDAWSQDNSNGRNLQVYLANFTAAELSSGIVPQEMGEPFPELDLARAYLQVRLPEVESVKLVSPDLAASLDLPFEEKEGVTKVKVPQLKRFDIVVFHQKKP